MMVMLPVMIWLEMISVTGSTYTDVYNFPMLGVLMFQRDGRGVTTPYGSVTIVKDTLAVCAAENLFQLDPAKQFYISNIGGRTYSLYVYVATDLLNPPSGYENNKVQRVQIKNIYLAKDTKWAGAMNGTYLKNANAVQNFVNKYGSTVSSPPHSLKPTESLASLEENGWVLNPFHELQWDIALLQLERPLKWATYVLPIADFTWNYNKLNEAFNKAWDVIEKAEAIPHEFVPCSVPGWSPIGNNEIIYHKVVYIRFKECADAICGAYPSTCLRYLNIRHHICFKSLSFADSCVLDQGAPVLCSWYPNNFIGVVTNAFDCGTENLPTIVTRKDAIEVFAALAKLPNAMDTKVPKLDDPAYTENPYA